jgi:hypothetical protein
MNNKLKIFLGLVAFIVFIAPLYGHLYLENKKMTSEQIEKFYEKNKIKEVKNEIGGLKLQREAYVQMLNTWSSSSNDELVKAIKKDDMTFYPNFELDKKSKKEIVVFLEKKIKENKELEIQKIEDLQKLKEKK